MPIPAPAALEVLVTEMTGDLFRLALRLLGNRAEAEDVLQDSYVRAFSASRRAQESAAGTSPLTLDAAIKIVSDEKSRRRLGQGENEVELTQGRSYLISNGPATCVAVFRVDAAGWKLAR